MAANISYGLTLSLDGYIANKTGQINLPVPEEALHRHFNKQQKRTALNLYGGMDVPEYNENCSYAVALALDAERTHSRFVFHVESLSRLAGYEDAQVAAWGVKFAADPAYAFECASNVAFAAASATFDAHSNA